MEVIALAKSYSPLMYRNKLAQILNATFNTQRYDEYTKFELHAEFSKIIFKNYRGEEYFKYLLAKEFFKKSVIAAFEVKVNNSRVDFLTINGDTRSFEIKSGRDNLKRLYKQSNDYSQVFEYNYVVTDFNHINTIIELVSPKCGIWTFENGKRFEIREAILNTDIEPFAQLSLLTKAEKKRFFCDDNTEQILKLFSPDQINEKFKIALKYRYFNRWSFIVEKNKDILPIDIQFFFNKNINPEVIYF